MSVDLHSPCIDCLPAVCDDDACSVAALDACTDDCLLVPCSDPTHTDDVCLADCLTMPCDIQPCDRGPDCSGPFDHLLACCADSHTQYDLSHHPPVPPFHWDSSLDFLPGNQTMHPSYTAPPYAQPGFLRSSSVQMPDTTINEQAAFTAFLGTYSRHPDPPGHHYAQGPIPPYFDPYSHQHAFASQQQHADPSGAGHQPQPEHKLLACQWAHCDVPFASMAELVRHVNHAHLRPALAYGTSAELHPEREMHAFAAAGVRLQTPVSCLWGDCQTFPTPAAIPGPSTGNHLDAALTILHHHLLEDHLGISTARYASPPQHPYHQHQHQHQQHEPIPTHPGTPGHTHAYTPPHHHPQTHAKPPPTPPTPPAHDKRQRDLSTPPSSSASPAPSTHDCGATHACRWDACGQTFGACDDLTAHIAAAHVGGGQSQYHCHWAGCARHGEQGFSSKQKILRHVQSHTGHRPFQCKICNQNFSEAATLQQHMRRHTQEKPYACDFPGCGKAFAIAGALTIHKRTHNGEKPFKCSHCGRAFAESSNLSKHLRTHTGARPYVCQEMGCEKAFARPDQLARHMNVHEKRRKTGAGAGAALMRIDD